MAKVKMARGSIVIQRGVSGEDLTPIVAIQTSFTPKLDLGGGHAIPIPMDDKDVKMVATKLSPEGQKALEVFLGEVEAMVLKAATEKARKIAGDTGIKLEG